MASLQVVCRPSGSSACVSQNNKREGATPELGVTKKLKTFWFNITIPGAKAPCSTRPKTPQACRSCQFHQLVATCQKVPSQQVPTNLSIS